jgi:hypothetical protein
VEHARQACCLCGVADGDLGAIDRLLRVLDRRDKYCAIEGADGPCDENARERLLTKLNAMADRIRQARETGGVDTERGDGPPSAETGLDAPDGIDFAEQSSTSSRRMLDRA